MKGEFRGADGGKLRVLYVATEYVGELVAKNEWLEATLSTTRERLAERKAEVERLRELLGKWAGEFPEFTWLDSEGSFEGELPDPETWHELVVDTRAALGDR